MAPAPRRAAAATSPEDVPDRPGYRPGYLPGLDGLRAVAVAAAISYHLGRLDGGFGGVDVFFVISGFLITRLLLAELESTGRVALGAFWVRRFKRLVPALMGVLVVVAVASRYWLPAWRLGSIRADSLSAMFYVANWRFVLSGQSYFSAGLAPSPLRHTWSLAIEEQFYLIWPIVFVGVAAVAKIQLRRAIAWVALAGAIASGVWMAVAASTGTDLSRLYFGTEARAFAVLAGAWLAAWWDPAAHSRLGSAGSAWRARWAWAGVIATVPLVGLLIFGSNDEVWFYQGGFQLLAALTVIMVAGISTLTGPMAAIFSVRPLLWVGRRSYGIYLWSWPVQVYASEYFRLEGLALDAAVVGLAMVAATLSFWLVEEPIRTGRRPVGLDRRIRRHREPRIPRFALSGIALAVVLAIIIGSSFGAPNQPKYTTVSNEAALAGALDPLSSSQEADLRAEAASAPVVDPGEPGPFSGAANFVVDDKLLVDPSIRLGRPMKVMVTGDSVGWSLGWDLPGGLTSAVAVNDRAIIGCGLMPPNSAFIVGSRPPEPYYDLCGRAELAELQGLDDNPDIALLWVGAWEVYDQVLDGVTYEVGSKEYGELMSWRIQERVDRYRWAGVPTVIPLVTCFGPNAARLGNERRDQDRIDWINSQLRGVAKRNRGWVRLIRPQDQLCDEQGDAIAETPDGVALREDGAHFDPTAAAWFWNTWLAGQMGAVLQINEPDQAED